MDRRIVWWPLVTVAAIGLAALIVHEARSQQLQPCMEQTDVYTVIITGSATLNNATFNFDTLLSTITFKGTTTLRVFTQTNQNAVKNFQNNQNPDQYFSTFSRTYHESLLATTATQVCPLLTEAGGYILTH